ncbi:hypothetical protein C4D60_Mb08t22530 [Musa balbisiana]|uniref:Small ribosomal subunit protein eS31 domain-containing protein n=1 Tax=Musa balbisiana TaxID=52838 RepID=A0A4S8K5P3_MUSBA|nr:hypothetical protein C4D60_Mb08t22530 [Musa balbisiana]
MAPSPSHYSVTAMVAWLLPTSGLKLEDGRCDFLSVPLGKRRQTKESMLVFTFFVPSVTLLFLQKKVKLAVLQFYKVDDATGKVTRLRKECPNAECGAGTFMANHFDRHYCGKCGLTYVYQKAQGE